MSKHYTPLYDWSWQAGRQIADPDDRARRYYRITPKGLAGE